MGVAGGGDRGVFLLPGRTFNLAFKEKLQNEFTRQESHTAMFRIRSVLLLALAIAFLVHLPGCGEQTEGFVFVDNGGPKTIIVEIDGKKMGSISSRKFKKFRLDLGVHHFRVTAGDEVIYDKQHTLDFGDRPFKRPTFLLNPDNSNRYCEASVVYGDDRLTQHSVDAMVTLISKAASKEATGGGDEATRRKWELDQKIKSKYRSLRNDLKAFGGEPFFRFETPHNILQPMPNAVIGSRHSSSSERSTLIRVPVEVHDAVYKLLQVEEPTAEDMRHLMITDKMVQALIPFR